MNIIELTKQAELYLDGENTQQPLYVLSPSDLERFAHLVVRAQALEQACEFYDAALKAACPEGAKGEAFYNWNEARYLTGRPYLGVKK